MVGVGGLTVMLRIKAVDEKGTKLKELREDIKDIGSASDETSKRVSKLDNTMMRMGVSAIFAASSSAVLALQHLGLIDRESALGEALNSTMAIMQLASIAAMVYYGIHLILAAQVGKTAEQIMVLKTSMAALGLSMAAIALTFYAINMESGNARTLVYALTGAVWGLVAAIVAMNVAKAVGLALGGPAGWAMLATGLAIGAAAGATVAALTPGAPAPETISEEEEMRKSIIESERKSTLTKKLRIEMGYETPETPTMPTLGEIPATTPTPRRFSYRGTNTFNFYNDPRQNAKEVSKIIETDEQRGLQNYSLAS